MRWRLGRGSAEDLGQSLFIKDLLARVQEELRDSQREREARSEEPIFEVDRLTLEVNFVAQVDSELRGGLDLKIVTAGAGQHYQSQQVHKVVLELVGVPQKDGDAALLDLETAPRFRPREDEDEATP